MGFLDRWRNTRVRVHFLGSALPGRLLAIFQSQETVLVRVGDGGGIDGAGLAVSRNPIKTKNSPSAKLEKSDVACWFGDGVGNLLKSINCVII